MLTPFSDRLRSRGGNNGFCRPAACATARRLARWRPLYERRDTEAVGTCDCTAIGLGAGLWSVLAAKEEILGFLYVRVLAHERA